MKTPRMRRVNETLREVIAQSVTRLKDPRVGFVTITAVDTAPDLRSAKVYYSVLGSAEEQQATAAALHSAASHIRGEVGRQVRLKYLPELRFERDEAMERGMRVQELLRQIERERGEQPGSDSQGS
ncbi:MAG: 30S ribosome-binding factor RbfA [Actinomycetota bacterium]|nr:30S ribosome-binding factor RbfA [Actinomycetota bacterium]